MVVDGTDLQGNDGMWQSAQMTGPFLRRAFTEMPCAPVAWTMLALALLWLGRFLWRRYWTVAIHVDSNGEITDIEPIGRGAATLYKREGIERLESFANSDCRLRIRRCKREQPGASMDFAPRHHG